MRVFHLTFAAALPSILRDGLRARPINNLKPYGCSEPALWVTANRSKLEPADHAYMNAKYARSQIEFIERYGLVPSRDVAVAVDLDANKPELWPWWDWLRAHGMQHPEQHRLPSTRNWYLHFGDIPAAAIVGVERTDMPLLNEASAQAWHDVCEMRGAA